MNFHSYTKLIVDSVAASGCDRFMPSLCVLADSTELHVLETEPQPEGDKQTALEWASGFTGPGRILFCAYRVDNRQVEVIEITGSDISDKVRIDVRPSEDLEAR